MLLCYSCLSMSASIMAGCSFANIIVFFIFNYWSLAEATRSGWVLVGWKTAPGLFQEE